VPPPANSIMRAPNGLACTVVPWSSKTKTIALLSGRQSPDARPFDIEGNRRRLDDGAERFGHIGLVPLGQLEEHLLSTASDHAVAGARLVP
jgi:hypothetical protein